jgi:Uma2 family endonuclease
VTNAAEQFVTRGEYLASEAEGSIRHEWVGGQLWAMTGGSGLHNRISIRIVTKLLPAADQSGCRTYMADMKVVTDAAGYYPDVMVVCDEAAPGDYHEEHPCLIVEVLSKTTEDRDRREKWVEYRSISSLKHYVLVSQSDVSVEHRYRASLGWANEVLGPDDVLTLTCPAVDIPVAEIYKGLLDARA